MDGRTIKSRTYQHFNQRFRFRRIIKCLLNINTKLYCILDIVCYVKFSLFSVSGLISVAIISYMVFFCSDRLLCKNKYLVYKMFMLKGDSQKREPFTPRNDSQYTVYSQLNVLQCIQKISIKLYIIKRINRTIIITNYQSLMFNIGTLPPGFGL